MPQILFTPLATEDLQQVFSFLAEKAGIEIANNFLITIRDKCQMLGEFPESGTPRHDLIVNLRSFSIKNYVIFYLPLDDGIDVLRIIHSSRDVTQIFEDMIPLEP